MYDVSSYGCYMCKYGIYHDGLPSTMGWPSEPSYFFCEKYNEYIPSFEVDTDLLHGEFECEDYEEVDDDPLGV